MGEDERLEELLSAYDPKGAEGLGDVVSDIREAFKNVTRTVYYATPPGRRQAVVLTHLEEAAMMAVKAVTHG